jgi:hypothetical protein
MNIFMLCLRAGNKTVTLNDRYWPKADMEICKFVSELTPSEPGCAISEPGYKRGQVQ